MTELDILAAADMPEDEDDIRKALARLEVLRSQRVER